MTTGDTYDGVDFTIAHNFRDASSESLSSSRFPSKKHGTKSTERFRFLDYDPIGKSEHKIVSSSRLLVVIRASALFLSLIAICLLWPPADRRGAAGFASCGILLGVVGIVAELRSSKSRRKTRLPRHLRWPSAFVVNIVLMGAIVCSVVPSRALSEKSAGIGLDGSVWAPNIGPVRRGDLQLLIASAHLEEGSDGRLLVVAIDVKNASPVHKVDTNLTGCQWNLSDEHGNEYRLQRDSMKTSSTSHTLYPGETYQVSMRFEPPVSRAERLDLRIRGNGKPSNGRLSDVTHFQIAPSFIRKTTIARSGLSSETPQPDQAAGLVKNHAIKAEDRTENRP